MSLSPLLYYFLSILSLVAFYCRRYPHFYQLPEKRPLNSRRYAYSFIMLFSLYTITDCFLLSPVSPFLSTAGKIPFKAKTLCLFLYYTAFLHTITDCFLLSPVYSFLSTAGKTPFKAKTLCLFLYYTAFLHTITDCFLLSPVFLFLSVAEKIPFKVKTLCLFPLLYCFSPYYHWLLSIVTGIPIFISCRKNAL